MRLGLSPVPQLAGTRGSPLAPECSALLQISIRCGVCRGVTEAIAPNYFQPLLKMFCAIEESLRVLRANGKRFDAMNKMGRGCAVLETGEWVGRLGGLGVPGGNLSAATHGQHQHSTPIPSYCDNKNGCKTDILGFLPFLPFLERPERRLEKRSVSS